MSWLMLLFSVVILTMTFVLSKNVYSQVLKSTINLIGTLAFLYFLGCAFTYDSFEHMLLSWNHDEVVLVNLQTDCGTFKKDFKTCNEVKEDFEKSGYRLVSVEDYRSIFGQELGHFSKMTFVKDNGKRNASDVYDKLTK